MVDAEDVRRRFWQKVVVGDACWEWVAAHGTSGCGQLSFDRRVVGAPRVSWWLHYGRMPLRSEHVCHRCDNPKCVRPDHLFLGSARDNMRDCIEKGRFKFLQPRFGVKNNNAKMTKAAVRKMRRLHKGGATISTLAREFRLARSTARAIVCGRTWRIDGVEAIPERQPIAAKLTAADREEIRRLVALKNQSKCAIARLFHVHVATVDRACGFR